MLASRQNSYFIQSLGISWQLLSHVNRLLDPFSPVIGSSEGLYNTSLENVVRERDFVDFFTKFLAAGQSTVSSCHGVLKMLI